MLTSQQGTRMQDHLQATLLNLLAQKPLEKITTGDLATAARVDRSTFYRYYHNKLELLGDALRQSVAPYLDDENPLSTSEAFTQLVYWLNDNRKVVKNIVLNNSSFNFYQEIIRLVTGMLKNQDGSPLQSCGPDADPIVEAISHAPNPDFAVEAFATSIVGVLMVWLNHPEMDVAAMQDYLQYTACAKIAVQ